MRDSPCDYTVARVATDWSHMRNLILDYYARHGDKLRFLVVGAFNTAVGYGLFLVMLAVFEAMVSNPQTVSLPAWLVANYYLLAQWSAWILSVPIGALTLKHWVFRRGGSAGPQIAKAYLVYLPTLALSSLTLWFAVQVIGLSPQMGQLIAIAVTVVFSYTGHKYYTFRGTDVSP